jgi:hypothetical protein
MEHYDVPTEPRSAPCLRCDKPDCGVMVIVPSVVSEKRQFNRLAETLSVTCPACDRPFSVSISKLEWLEVQEGQLKGGFL